jgi:hypothetical protein
MYSKLKAYVRSCDSCHRNKTSNQSLLVCSAARNSNRTFRTGEYGLFTALPETKENIDAVMVIVHKLTKLVIFIPARTNMAPVTIAKLFFNNWYRWFGLPQIIMSGRDGRFISKFWKELFRLMQTRLAVSTINHP